MILHLIILIKSILFIIFDSIYFAIFDKTNNDLDITKIDRIYNMESIVKKYKSEIGVEEDNDRSYIAKKEELINAFGNKKSKTIMKKQNENKVDENNTFGKHIVSKIIKKQGKIMREKITKRKLEDIELKKEKEKNSI